MWTTESQERLYEGECQSCEAEYRMRIGHDEHETVRPASNLQKYTDHPGYGARPDQEHDQPVPYEPLGLATTVSISPGVFVISCQDDA